MFLLIIFVSSCLKEWSFLKHLITVSGRTPPDICGRHYHHKRHVTVWGIISTSLGGKQMVEMLGIWEIPSFGIFQDYSTNLKHGVTSRFSHFKEVILKILIRIHGKRWPTFFHHFGQQIVVLPFHQHGNKKFEETPNIKPKKQWDFPLQTSVFCLCFFLPSGKLT